MMAGFLEFGLIGILGLGNTPWKEPSPMDTIPSLRWEVRPTQNLFLAGDIASRCQPSQAHRWNPRTALWTIETGFQSRGLRISIGHTSEHGIDRIVPFTESRDFVSMRYRIEF